MKGGKGGNPQRNHKNKSLEEAAKALPFENLKRKSPKEEKVPCLHIKVDDFVLFFLSSYIVSAVSHASSPQRKEKSKCLSTIL